MRWRLSLLCLMFASPALAQGPAESELAADEALLRDAKLPTKGAALLQTLRDRTPTPALIAQFHKQVARLHANAYAERLSATGDLVKMGPVVRPLLENLLRDTKADQETVRRLKHILDQFPADKDF